MTQGAAVRQVSTPLEEVWAAVADHQRMAQWGPGMAVRMERIGDPDANGVGAVRAIKDPFGTIREEITEFQPGRLLAYRALSGVPVPNWRGRVELVEHQGRTVIRWQVETSARVPALLLHAFAGFMLGRLLRTV
jgi:uncharacterized protein YndB with AHSA1/START domain